MNRGVDLTSVREVLHRAGIRTGHLVLVNAGVTLVVRDGDRVVRISPESVDKAEETLHLALRLAAAGAPVLAPIEETARETLLGVVTLWEVAAPSPEPERDLGTALRGLHRSDFPGVRARAVNRHRIKREVMQLEHHGVDTATIEELRRIAAALPEEPGWGDDPGAVVVHGDAHRGNVMRRAGRPVLIDLEDVHFGPAELDLLPTWCSARRGHDGWWAWQQLRDSYNSGEGPDTGRDSHFTRVPQETGRAALTNEGLWEWSHLEEAVLERELMTTLFLCRRWREDVWVREEVTHRVRTWDDTRAVWNTGLRRT